MTFPSAIRAIPARAGLRSPRSSGCCSSCRGAHQQRRPVFGSPSRPRAAHRMRRSMLGLRVADLEQQADMNKRRPAPINQAEFATARRALDERMTRLEEAEEAGPWPSTCERCWRA